MRHLLLSLAILLGLSAPAHTGTIDPKVNDSKYVEYGAKHECVVQICGEYPKQSINDSKVLFLASSVIVKPRIVLTAAHVVQEAENMYIKLRGEKIKISSAVILKAYDKEKFGPFDLAICHLEKDAFIDFYPELYDKDDEVGKICSISGFGMTGNHRYGAKVHDGKKRAGSNVVDEICSGMLLCSVNKKPYTELEFLIASGDSGGGLFIDKKLAGINSTIMTEKGGTLNSDIQDESCHTRISLHKPWIDFVISELEKSKSIQETKISKNLFDFF
jgi:hypothetical protein